MLAVAVKVSEFFSNVLVQQFRVRLAQLGPGN